MISEASRPLSVTREYGMDAERRVYVDVDCRRGGSRGERERVKEEELGTGDLKNLEDRSGGCGEGEKEGTGKKRVATRRAKNIIISSP
jgi:hypothetical protein